MDGYSTSNMEYGKFYPEDTPSSNEAYTLGLEAEVTQLKEENRELRGKQAFAEFEKSKASESTENYNIFNVKIDPAQKLEGTLKASESEYNIFNVKKDQSQQQDHKPEGSKLSNVENYDIFNVKKDPGQKQEDTSRAFHFANTENYDVFNVKREPGYKDSQSKSRYAWNLSSHVIHVAECYNCFFSISIAIFNAAQTLRPGEDERNFNM